MRSRGMESSECAACAIRVDDRVGIGTQHLIYWVARAFEQKYGISVAQNVALEPEPRLFETEKDASTPVAINIESLDPEIAAIRSVIICGTRTPLAAI